MVKKCWLKICYNLPSFFYQPGNSLVQQCFLIAQIKLSTNSKGLGNCVQFENTINKHEHESLQKIFMIYFLNYFLCQLREIHILTILYNIILDFFKMVFFDWNWSLFLKLWLMIMSNFYIATFVSIDCLGQSCLRDSGKLSFGPVTSGKVSENYL